MRKITAVIIALMFPLLLGTTYIVRENGKEVGKWSENDGNDVTRYIDNAVSKTEPRTVAKPQKTASEQDENSDKKQDIGQDVEPERWRERREDFGIRQGITQEQLESIAQENGLRRKTKYSDNDGPDYKRYWIHEYTGETEHFKHFLKIYLGPESTVEKVFHSVEEK